MKQKSQKQQLKCRHAISLAVQHLFLCLQDDPPHISSSQEVATVPPPPPHPKNSIFEDEERSRRLQKLLQSKNPEDLVAANMLIKMMVKEVLELQYGSGVLC
jgi:hypothetical protein